MHRAEGQSRQRRAFLDHLRKWTSDHDASLHFHGKLSLLPRGAERQCEYEFGKPVTCVLTDTSFPDARQTIVIKLFPPQEDARTLKTTENDDMRRDSMELNYPSQRDTKETTATSRQHASTGAKAHYKLVVRCGAGWMSARDFFSKTYFSRLEARASVRRSLCNLLETRSKALGPRPSDKDTVTIRPLFHPFRTLPAELQEMVLFTAAGLSKSYNLCSDDYGIPSVKKKDSRSAISLSTLFRVSKSVNEHLLPFAYRSTDFHFGLTGFTNFLWQSGPGNRRDVRRLTFHFGKLALLHCIRWMAPDPVFDLLEPPVATNPRSLQYFWRCQIQDLAKDLDLLTLTINIKNIPTEDIPVIVSIMKNAFGSVEKLHFIEADRDGTSTVVPMDDERLKGVTEEQTWRDMCLGYYRSHRTQSYYFKFELLKGDEQVLEDAMDSDREFYYKQFFPLNPTEDYPKWK